MLDNPGLRFLLSLMAGRVVDALLDSGPGRRFIDGISGAEGRDEHAAVVRDYAEFATTLAVNFLMRPPEADTDLSRKEPLMDRGRINWQRALEVTAELLLVLGPLLKLISDYSRNRQNVSPERGRG